MSDVNREGVNSLNTFCQSVFTFSTVFQTPFFTCSPLQSNRTIPSPCLDPIYSAARLSIFAFPTQITPLWGFFSPTLAKESIISSQIASLMSLVHIFYQTCNSVWHTICVWMWWLSTRSSRRVVWGSSLGDEVVVLHEPARGNVHETLFSRTYVPSYAFWENAALCSHFPTSDWVTLTQQPPVTRFPLVLWPCKQG